LPSTFPINRRIASEREGFGSRWWRAGAGRRRPLRKPQGFARFGLFGRSGMFYRDLGRGFDDRVVVRGRRNR